MLVRSATAQDATGIVALNKAANPYGDWYRNPFEKLGKTRYEDLTPLERFLHGGFWMDLSLCRRHLHEYQRRGFPVLVAEDKGRIVGECEVWLDEEPEPFGRYAEVEMIISGRPPNPEVERELLARVAERVRKMGYAAVDISYHSGRESVLATMGFERLWDTRTFEADAKAVTKPEEEFETRYLTGGYGDLRGLLLLNHHEPAGWRYETLTARWPAAELAALRDGQEVVELAVETGDLGFSVLAGRRDWLDPAVSEIDVWMKPSDFEKAKTVRAAFGIAAEVARRLRTKRITAYAPPSAAKVLHELGFTGGEKEDLWLRWRF